MRRPFLAVVAAGLALLAAAAIILVARDGDRREARIPTVPKITETDVLHAYDLTRAAGFRAERAGMFWSVRGAPALAAGSAPHLLDNYRVVRQSPEPEASLRPGVFVRSGGSRGFRPTPIMVWVAGA